jgi:hypothetical protein
MTNFGLASACLIVAGFIISLLVAPIAVVKYMLVIGADDSSCLKDCIGFRTVVVFRLINYIEY